MINIKLSFSNLVGAVRELLAPEETMTLDQLVADLSAQEISKELFLNIPTVSGSVNLIRVQLQVYPLNYIQAKAEK